MSGRNFRLPLCLEQGSPWQANTFIPRVRYFAFPGIDTQVQGISILCESTVWDILLSLA
jgi:hypothetical protein